MTAAEESQFITEAVRRTYAESGVSWPTAESGPVPLQFLIADSGLRQTEIVGLNHAAVSAHLRSLGTYWSDVPDPDPKLAGFICANDCGGHIFVRREDSLPRRRFSAAHELGHFALHLRPDLEASGPGAEMVRADETLSDSGEVSPDKMEREANRFAAELLMPESTCRALCERYTRKYGTMKRFLVHHLATELLVSREAAKWRLEELRLIASSEKD